MAATERRGGQDATAAGNLDGAEEMITEPCRRDGLLCSRRAEGYNTRTGHHSQRMEIRARGMSSPHPGGLRLSQRKELCVDSSPAAVDWAFAGLPRLQSQEREGQRKAALPWVSLAVPTFGYMPHCRREEEETLSLSLVKNQRHWFQPGWMAR